MNSGACCDILIERRAYAMKKWKSVAVLVLIFALVCLTMKIAPSDTSGKNTDNPEATTGATAPASKDSARSVPAESAKDICASGRRYLVQKNYPAALIRFDRAISLYPEFAKAYYLRGRARLNMDMPTLALNNFTEAIELKPGDTRLLAGALYSRGALRVEMKEYAGAIEDLTEAIALLPDQAIIYKKRADAYKASGMIKKALRDYKKAIELNPEYGPLLKDKLLKP